MKLEPPINANYCAAVVEIRSLVELEGCDNICGAPLLGYQAIVSKDTQPGDIGIVFTAETELSDDYARRNNLYSSSEQNADPEAKGYLGKRPRIKAIKLRGHRSDALFMPLASLDYTGVANELQVGDVFDHLGGVQICKKYEKTVKASTNAAKQMAKAAKAFERVDAKFLPLHYDTSRYWGNEDKIPADAQIVVTQKLHGTSLRAGNTIVRLKPTWRERLAERMLRVQVQKYRYDQVYGSRKVVKDANNTTTGYYDTDIWTIYGRTLDGLIPEGFIVYAELIGWTPDGAPIQKNYTYDLPDRAAELYVYRVAYVNPQGVITDLSWDQLEEFCGARGLKTVPVLWRGVHSEFDVDNWIDRRFYDMGCTQAVPLSGSKKLVDEGVCIRMDGLVPVTLKAKSPVFLQHETKQLDDESSVDLEAEGSAS